MIVGLVVVAVIVLVGVVRARRKHTLAGLNNERPVFSVEPPLRRHGQLKDGHL